MSNNNITIPFELEENEEAKIIENYPNYIITSHGRLYSTKFKRFIGKENKKTHYMQATLMPGFFRTYIHRLVLQNFGEPSTEGKNEIHHIDKNPHNNTIDNLKWVTHEENLQDRKPYTENRKQRLTKKLMKEFNRWYIENQNQLYNLSNQAVSNRCKNEIGIDVNIQTIMINRGHWAFDENNELVRI